MRREHASLQKQPPWRLVADTRSATTARVWSWPEPKSAGTRIDTKTSPRARRKSTRTLCPAWKTKTSLPPAAPLWRRTNAPICYPPRRRHHTSNPTTQLEPCLSCLKELVCHHAFPGRETREQAKPLCSPSPSAHKEFTRGHPFMRSADQSAPLIVSLAGDSRPTPPPPLRIGANSARLLLAFILELGEVSRRHRRGGDWAESRRIGHRRRCDQVGGSYSLTNLGAK